MQLIKLEKNDYELLEGLDPLGLLCRAKLSRGFVLAAIEQEKDGDEDTILGIVICTESWDSLIIEWLSVDEQWQGKGTGDEIIFELSSLARNAGKKYLKAYIPTQVLGDDYTDSGMAYFECHGFIGKTTLAGEWTYDMETFSKEFGIYLKQRPKWIMDMHLLQSARKRDILIDLSRGDKTAHSFFESYNNRKYSEDLSFFVIGDQDRVKGALLVEVVDSMIYPSVFYVDTEDTALMLLGNLSMAVRDKYGAAADEMTINMIFTDGDKKKLESMMPDNRSDNYYLIATL